MLRLPHNLRSLRTQTIAVLLVMVTSVSIATIVAYSSQLELFRLQERIRSNPRSCEAISDVLLAALTCQARESECLLAPERTPRERSLRGWNVAAVRMQRALENYQALQSPRQGRRAETWLQWARQYRAEFIRASTATGDQSSTTTIEASVIPSYQAPLKALIEDATRRRQALTISTQWNQRSLERLLNQAMRLILLRFAIAICVLAGFAVWFFRNILRRICSLSHAVDRVTAGDLGIHLTDASRDELGSLANRFNEMAEAIRLSEQRWKLEVAQHGETILHLRAAKEAAQVASRAKSEFLANMSHEIRTPMTAILGFTEIAMSASDSPEVRHATQTIKRNGEYLLNILSDILDLSKIEAGYVEIDRRACSVFQIVDEVVALARVPADAKRLPLDVEFRGALPATIQTDATKLRQILLNLVVNAIKFTELGSVRLAVEMVSSTGGSPQIRFDVIDTGIGIAPQQVSKLFRPFTQSDSSTTRRFGGTGLGLSISKRLTEMLGGTISIDSKPGGGSTFTVTIATGALDGVELIDPSHQASPQHSAADSADTQTRLNCRVLLVEDGPDNQRLVSFILSRAGATVVIANNGEEALAQVADTVDANGFGRPFDVVLMDIQMPIMDGYEATRRLRAAGHQMAIIALTAHATVENRDRCLAEGFDAFVSKPIHAQRLVALIASLIGNQNPERKQQDSVSVELATV